MVADTETDWPYDADRDDPLTALRIPVVSHAWPRWYYIVAFDLDGIDRNGNRPTGHEAAMLKSFLDQYIDYWYRPSWVTKMLERPFDIDGGANGYIFRKWGEDDWGYRQRTWQYAGPTFWPGGPWWRKEHGEGLGKEAHSLLRSMDHIHSRGSNEPSDRWVSWKAAHPDVFGATS